MDMTRMLHKTGQEFFVNVGWDLSSYISSSEIASASGCSVNRLVMNACIWKINHCRACFSSLALRALDTLIEIEINFYQSIIISIPVQHANEREMTMIFYRFSYPALIFRLELVILLSRWYWSSVAITFYIGILEIVTLTIWGSWGIIANCLSWSFGSLFGFFAHLFSRNMNRGNVFKSREKADQSLLYDGITSSICCVVISRMWHLVLDVFDIVPSMDLV